jgi:hypothetical protein
MCTSRLHAAVIISSSQSSAGVLLLHAADLKKKEQEQLADALGRTSLALCQDPCLVVPVTASLWMLASACRDTLSKVPPPQSAVLESTCMAALVMGPD